MINNEILKELKENDIREKHIFDETSRYYNLILV
jgi:hypothetical protein